MNQLTISGLFPLYVSEEVYKKLNSQYGLELIEALKIFTEKEKKIIGTKPINHLRWLNNCFEKGGLVKNGK